MDRYKADILVLAKCADQWQDQAHERAKALREVRLELEARGAELQEMRSEMATRVLEVDQLRSWQTWGEAAEARGPIWPASATHPARLHWDSSRSHDSCAWVAARETSPTLKLPPAPTSPCITETATPVPQIKQLKAELVASQAERQMLASDLQMRCGASLQHRRSPCLLGGIAPALASRSLRPNGRRGL